MPKQKLPPQLLLAPLPAALISCGRENGEQSIITLAWVGVVNSEPPMVSIAVRPNRHSHSMIEETKEFTVNIPTVEQADLVDGCGILSGKKVNKFNHFGLTPTRGVLKYAPLIEQCPINMECVVEHKLALGSHNLFIGRVVQSYADAAILDEQGRVDFNRFTILGFSSGEYLSAVPINLAHGYTVKK